MTRPEIMHLVLLPSNRQMGMDEIAKRIATALSGDVIQIVDVEVSPPAFVPLWRGVAIGDGYSIRDAGGNAVGTTKAGEALAIYAEGVVAGSYANRVVITAPGVTPVCNVWREGVKRT